MSQLSPEGDFPKENLRELWRIEKVCACPGGWGRPPALRIVSLAIDLPRQPALVAYDLLPLPGGEGPVGFKTLFLGADPGFGPPQAPRRTLRQGGVGDPRIDPALRSIQPAIQGGGRGQIALAVILNGMRLLRNGSGGGLPAPTRSGAGAPACAPGCCGTAKLGH